MINFGLEFHHFGLAARRLSDAMSFVSGLGYTVGDRVFDPEQNVTLSLCRHVSMPAIEIICPSGTAGPIDKYLAHHPDGLIYHLCYEAEDLKASLRILEAANLRVICVAEPRPAVLFGGRLV